MMIAVLPLPIQLALTFDNDNIIGQLPACHLKSHTKKTHPSQTTWYL